MISHLRRNAIAYLALFVALGGTAFAATKIGSKQIKTNAVKARHIADNAVRAGEIADGAIGASEIADGSVGSGKVADNSLTGTDIDEATLVPGSASAAAQQSVSVPLVNGDTTLVETQITIPRTSRLLASASVFLNGNGGGDDQPRCNLFYTGTSGGSQGLSGTYRATIPDTTGDEITMSLVGGAAVGPGTYDVDLRCDIASGGTASALGSDLIAWSLPS